MRNRSHVTTYDYQAHSDDTMKMITCINKAFFKLKTVLMWLPKLTFSHFTDEEAELINFMAAQGHKQS